MNKVLMPFGKFGIAALMAASVLVGCSEDEVAPQPTSLEITALDELGNSVSGATVYIYANESDYIKSDTDKAIATGTTNSSGVYEASGLDSKIYYFDVVKELEDEKAITNVTTGNRVLTALEANTRNELNVVLEESIMGYLVGLGTLETVAFYEDDTDLTSAYLASCAGDDYSTFYKDLTLVELDNANKCEDTNASETMDYTVSGSNIIVDGVTFSVNYIGIDGVVVQATDGTTVYTIGYEPVN